MAWIHMLETRRGSEDGHIVRLFNKDKFYEVTEGLAHEFIAKGWAESVPHDPSKGDAPAEGGCGVSDVEKYSVRAVHRDPQGRIMKSWIVQNEAESAEDAMMKGLNLTIKTNDVKIGTGESLTVEAVWLGWGSI